MMNSDDLFTFLLLLPSASSFLQGVGVSGIGYVLMSHTQIIAAVRHRPIHPQHQQLSTTLAGHFSYFRWQR
jgi:hypothetical protein